MLGFKSGKNYGLYLIITTTLLFAGYYFVFASTTDGTIDSVNKYAWGSNIGWVNFGATQGNVHITNSGLTGYAWSANYGWINLNPSQGGVINDGNGNLSGYAWGEKIGYINFSGVIINSSGVFTGVVTTNNLGNISFNCANCLVSTDWRPQSSATTPSTNNQNTGGGSLVYQPALSIPAPNQQILPPSNNPETGQLFTPSQPGEIPPKINVEIPAVTNPKTTPANQPAPVIGNFLNFPNIQNLPIVQQTLNTVNKGISKGVNSVVVAVVFVKNNLYSLYNKIFTAFKFLLFGK